MKTCPYRPLGTRVVLKMLPVMDDSLLVLPDGKVHLKTHQTYEVMAVGGEVNDETFSLTAGEIVLVACHESEVFPLRKEDKLIIVDRSKLITVVETTALN